MLSADNERGNRCADVPFRDGQTLIPSSEKREKQKKFGKNLAGIL